MVFEACLFAKSIKRSDEEKKDYKEWCHPNLSEFLEWFKNIKNDFDWTSKGQRKPVQIIVFHEEKYFLFLFEDDGFDCYNRPITRVTVIKITKEFITDKKIYSLSFNGEDKTVEISDEESCNQDDVICDKFPLVLCNNQGDFSWKKMKQSKLIEFNKQDSPPPTMAGIQKKDLSQPVKFSEKNKKSRINYVFMSLGVVLLCISIFCNIFQYKVFITQKDSIESLQKQNNYLEDKNNKLEYENLKACKKKDCQSIIGVIKDNMGVIKDNLEKLETMIEE